MRNLLIGVFPLFLVAGLAAAALYILAGVLNELILRSVIVLHNHKGTIRKKDLIQDIFDLLGKNVVRVPLAEQAATS